MACIEVDERILIVDVGLSFPSGDMPGIDLVLPDFDYVRHNADRVEAVVLTHGHEDHIGALPYLLREISGVPVYGTPFTLELLKGKLEEHQVADRCELRTAVPGEGATRRPLHDAVPSRDPLDPRRDGRGGRHAATARSCTPATSRSTRPRSTVGPPTCTASPRRRAARACTSCSATRRTPRRPGTRRASGRWGRCSPTSWRTRPRSWWLPASRATSTACSRS